MAVKQVDLPLTPSDRMKKELKAFVDALRSERQTLRQLDHENIVQYLGFEENTETVNVYVHFRALYCALTICHQGSLSMSPVGL